LSRPGHHTHIPQREGQDTGDAGTGGSLDGKEQPALNGPMGFFRFAPPDYVGIAKCNEAGPTANNRIGQGGSGLGCQGTTSPPEIDRKIRVRIPFWPAGLINSNGRIAA